MKNQEESYELLKKELLWKFEQISLLVDYCKKPQGGWICSFGKALGLSHSQLATKLGVSEKELTSLVENEINDKVIPNNIKQLASILGGRFEYIFIPNNLSVIKKALAIKQLSKDAQIFKSPEQLPPLPSKPSNGWISFVRKARKMSRSQFAKKLNLKESDIWQIEKYESLDRFLNKDLIKVAQALGYKAEYFFIPNESLSSDHSINIQYLIQQLKPLSNFFLHPPQ